MINYVQCGSFACKFVMIILCTPAFSQVQEAQHLVGDPVIDMGSRRELFVDRYLIDRLDGVHLELHPPRFADIALSLDQPWEGDESGFPTVIKDGDTYHLYYRGLPLYKHDDTDKTDCKCYATSRDGIHWSRPNLGLFEVKGTRNNNVIMDTQTFTPFLDTRPDVPVSQRFKAIKAGALLFASGDGIHWKPMHSEPLKSDVPDSIFWSAAENCYVQYTRLNIGGDGGIRSIRRSTSQDLIRWSEYIPMEFGGWLPTRQEQLYTSATTPYFRAPHIYISLAARFMEGRRVLTDTQAQQLGSVNAADCSEGIFMTTRGGKRYDRTFMEGFIRPGIGDENWVSRTNYPGPGLIPTGPDEMSIYVTRHYHQKSCHIARYTLRLDGFASVNAPYKGGEMVTKAIRFSGDTLWINYATSAAGSIQVEIQDETGVAISGFTSEECPRIIGNKIAYKVSWKDGTDLSSLDGKSIRLRFIMKDADLYSIRFGTL